jgi:hypothetical protein
VKGKRLQTIVPAPLFEAIEQLLWTGLYGATRGDVVHRLISESVVRRVSEGLIKIEELHEDWTQSRRSRDRFTQTR